MYVAEFRCDLDGKPASREFPSGAPRNLSSELQRIESEVEAEGGTDVVQYMKR